MNPLIDPRLGDVEDDASSTKQRSMLRLAGSLLAEVSLPKLAAAWLLLIVLPSVLLGLAPLAISGWLATLSGKLVIPLGEIWPLLLFTLVIGAGWFGGRPLLRAAERGFWSLNALFVQPVYALCRESLRHLADLLTPLISVETRARLRAVTAFAAGLVICGIASGVTMLVWPATRWIGQVADLTSPHLLLVPALANAAVLLNIYLAVAALAWGLADATMDQPRDLSAFDRPPSNGRAWRIAHLSDLHIVGERYGFRIECGRAGPRGNDRLARLLAQLDAIHAERPLDIILMTGDITDAGRAPEWAEFLSMLACHPELAKRTLILPGNHDLNVVDRANPARLDLPMAPGKRLRQMRTLSAIAAVQGTRVQIVDPATGQLGGTLADAVAPHRLAITAFADTGARRFSAGLARLWADIFPLVLPPETDDGLGVVLLNSCAETHFSFSNALGLVSADQAHRLAAAVRQFPHAHWIVALHHHLAEYPKLATTFSERIGTALINGTWFVRQLRPLRGKSIALHGHRHIDWIGECDGTRIISAPSPVMEATDDESTSFHIHTLVASSDGRLLLLDPETIEIPGQVAHAATIVGASA